MATTARSIASLSLGFGLVSIPVRLFTATESASAVQFNMLTKDGERAKQQYVCASNARKIVPRSEMVKGYEFEEDRFVIFQPAGLKALEEGASHLIDIVALIPADAVDPIYYDKPYFLAPDKRGGKPYNLLKRAMQESGRCALAKWAWKSKQYVVQVRAQDEGLVLRQLLYAEEVRSIKDLGIEQLEPCAAELKLALQLIQQISRDPYDPTKLVRNPSRPAGCKHDDSTEKPSSKVNFWRAHFPLSNEEICAKLQPRERCPTRGLLGDHEHAQDLTAAVQLRFARVNAFGIALQIKDAMPTCRKVQVRIIGKHSRSIGFVAQLGQTPLDSMVF